MSLGINASDIFLFFSWIYANGQFVENWQLFADFAADDCAQHGKAQRGKIERDGDWCGHDAATVLEHQRKVGDGNWVRQIGEIGMFAELMKQRIEEGWILLIGKYRKEEQRCRNGVEDTSWAKLMGGVDSLKWCITIDGNQLVVVSKQ